MEYPRYERYTWDSTEEAFRDLGIDGAKKLVLVDSDCIVYPTAFSNVTVQGAEAAQEAAVGKLHRLLGTLPKGDDYHVVQVFTSSGSPKYRDQFIKQVPYKANRKTKTGPIPQYVTEITEALTEHSVSIYCDPLVGEADDYLSILAREFLVTFGEVPHLMGQDKDLLQIPGYHYRGTVNRTIMTFANADRFLYRQILAGDTADNVPGLRGVGPKIAENLIPDSMTDDNEMFDVVVKEYCKRMKGTVDEITDYLFETANLLYLRRGFDDHWNPPIV